MTDNDYIIHRIPKRDGTMRILHEPKPALKLKQRQIQRYLQARGIKCSYHAHGFTPGRSAVTHAKNHLHKRVIIKCDIEDFFGSTTKNMVSRALCDCGLDKNTIDDVCNICLLNNALPQGAPTSPLLSNLAFLYLDKRLSGLAKKFKASYSRYADDMCFSSNNPQFNAILPQVKYVVENCGYKLKDSKTRVLRRNRSQIVTGVVVNQKLNVPRELKHNTRARLFKLKQALLTGKAFDETEFTRLCGLVAYFQAVSAETASKFRAAVREIEALLAMSSRLAATKP
ncbi:MAG: reverse transcriptase family protein [Victivallaceae bacterium]|jgi:RNA-directed DNA polymerase